MKSPPIYIVAKYGVPQKSILGFAFLFYM